MKKYSHLTLTERSMIERYLTQGFSFKAIASFIDRSLTTVSREVKKNRTVLSSDKTRCTNFYACRKRKICGDNLCFNSCKNCSEYDCKTICNDFSGRECPKLTHAPFCCNSCSEQEYCRCERSYYQAHKAHFKYTQTLSASRKSIKITESEAKKLNELLTPLIKKGQSINHIFATHGNEINLSKKTIYNYIDRSVLEIRNIDLPRKVRYKQRKRKSTLTKEFKYREGRSYKDFQDFIKENPNTSVVEMDTVKSTREKGKCLLTMIFAQYDFMLIFLLESCTQDEVKRVFEYLYKALGHTVFKRLFKVILTDNGSEFKNAKSLETSEFGTPRTRIFYCDPMSSWQKPHIEKSHEFIRKVIPKGRTFNNLSQCHITKLTNHINSFARVSLENQTPFHLAQKFIGPKVKFLLELKAINPDDVTLKPSLLF